MGDVTTTVHGYIALWNEADRARRRALIARTWTEDATYVDPLTSADGHDAIDGMIAAVQDRFPGHAIRLTSEVDAHHDVVRFGWALTAPGGDPVASGIDFAVLAPDGRLRSVTGFLEPARSPATV